MADRNAGNYDVLRPVDRCYGNFASHRDAIRSITVALSAKMAAIVPHGARIASTGRVRQLTLTRLPG